MHLDLNRCLILLILTIYSIHFSQNRLKCILHKIYLLEIKGHIKVIYTKNYMQGNVLDFIKLMSL